MSSPKREAAPSSEGSIRERAPSASDVEFNYPTSYAATEPFAKPHTVVVLMVLLAMLCYAVFSMEGQSSTENAKTCVPGGRATATSHLPTAPTARARLLDASPLQWHFRRHQRWADLLRRAPAGASASFACRCFACSGCQPLSFSACPPRPPVCRTRCSSGRTPPSGGL